MCFSYRKVVYLLSHSNNDLIGFGFGLGLGKEKRTPDGSPLSIKQIDQCIIMLGQIFDNQSKKKDQNG